MDGLSSSEIVIEGLDHAAWVLSVPVDSFS